MRSLPPISIGRSMELSAARELQADPGVAEPQLVRVVLRWEELQAGPGGLDLAPLDRLKRLFPADRFAVVLCLTGGNRALRDGGGAPAYSDGEYHAAWLEFARAVAQRARGWADLFQVWDRPQSGQDWGAAPAARDYAFLLKSTAVTIRSVIPWARVISGGLDAARPGFLQELYRHEIAPYTDAVALAGRPSDVDDAALENMRRLILEGDPSSTLWFPAVPVDSAGTVAAAEVAREFGLGVGRGASVTLFRLGAGARDGAEATIRSLRRSFPVTTALAVRGEDERWVREDGAVAVRSFRFLDSVTLDTTLWYAAEQGGEAEAELTLPTHDVSSPTVVDPIAGSEKAIDFYIPDRASGTTRIDVPLGQSPRLLVYGRGGSDDLRLVPDSLEVAGASVLTVEEILVRHQEHQSALEDRLKTYLAEFQVELHLQFSGNNTLDVAYKGVFYYDNGVAEWERREFYLNGVRWKAKKVPKIPLLQPDKVVILPLDLHLDKRYRYRLEGEESLDGRRTWRISFAPAEKDASLPRGRVWIDQRNYARVQMALKQSGMEPPFVSNDELDHYRPVVGPDGGEYWVLTQVGGSQIYSIAGRTLNVSRDVVFTGIRINPADFQQRKEEAYRSDSRILRDTDMGARYLEKGADGERFVEEKLDPDQLFWLGGVFYDPAAGVFPLAGVNYFTFDLAGTGTQMNVFFAGLFLAFDATDPDLFGGPLEGGIDVQALAIDLTDSFFVDGDEIESLAVDRKSPSMRLFLAAPFAKFFRVVGAYELHWNLFSRAADTAPEFIVPVDTFIHSGELRFDFSRRGWAVDVAGSYGRRQDWEPWGTPEQQAAFDPATQDWYSWGAGLSKNIFLPKFQKLRFAASWDTGWSQDRFSAFPQGGLFSNFIAGFSGSSVRYERGGIARAEYAFNVFEVLRFQAGVDYGHFLNPAESPDFRKFVGVGIEAEFMGPWGTLMSLEYGIAVHSDIPSLEGDQQVLFSFLKLF